jgi:hypothetical protein
VKLLVGFVGDATIPEKLRNFVKIALELPGL